MPFCAASMPCISRACGIVLVNITRLRISDVNWDVMEKSGKYNLRWLTSQQLNVAVIPSLYGLTTSICSCLSLLCLIGKTTAELDPWVSHKIHRTTWSLFQQGPCPLMIVPMYCLSLLSVLVSFGVSLSSFSPFLCLSWFLRSFNILFSFQASHYHGWVCVLLPFFWQKLSPLVNVWY